MHAARRMRPLALASLLLAAVSVSGCGGGGKSTSASSGRLSAGTEASACGTLQWELKRLQAASNVAELESSGTSASVVTSIEAIKEAVKQLAHSPEAALSKAARSDEDALSEYERQGGASVAEHLTGKKPWKAGTPTLGELCP